MPRAKEVRVCVLRTAGTNCDYETAYAFEKVGARTERIHVNLLAGKPGALDRFHVLVLPGGFSYGDDIASGKVLANELRHRLEDDIRRFKADGKLMIGICNGFQILVKAGLLPGLKSMQIEATLTNNDRGRFDDRWIYLRAEDSVCAFVRPGDNMYLPIAHGEGKFVADDKVMAEIRKRRMVVLRYAAADYGPAKGFPDNPNGSLDDIAGICDPTGRIFGLMPHPERHVEPTHHPRWTREGLKSEGDGLKVFRNAVDFARREFA